MRLWPSYHQLQESGQTEVSTTPFYHPILPLLEGPQHGVALC
ncbi:MAG: hypothetical protein AB1671_02820 [Thermodesulfobacteriota bacterium]